MIPRYDLSGGIEIEMTVQLAQRILSRDKRITYEIDDGSFSDATLKIVL